MAQNVIDYEILETGVTTYANQAGALDDVITALVNMNGELQAGWTNNTSNAFIERFEEEYKPALENIRDAVQSISDFISSYLQDTQDNDAERAASLKG